MRNEKEGAYDRGGGGRKANESRHIVVKLLRRFRSSFGCHLASLKQMISENVKSAQRIVRSLFILEIHSRLSIRFLLEYRLAES